MRRREAMTAVGTLLVAGVAGCNDRAHEHPHDNTHEHSHDNTHEHSHNAQSTGTGTPGGVDKPDAVYYPAHVEGMEMVGVDSANGYKCALTYSFPHRFWLVTGTRRNVVTVESDDAVHLMPVVWDAETGIIPPDVNPQVTISQDGESVTTLSPWPMLSQPMGFHFGDNVALPNEGTYQVEVTIGESSSRRTGALAGERGGASFSFGMDFAQSTLEDIVVRDVPADQQGTRGAVDPMSMEMLPSSQVPAESDLPGQVQGSANGGDGSFVVTVLDDATTYGGGESQQYLVVSARTPYNRYPLTHMSLSATLDHDGKTVYDDALTSTLDPDLAAHYGAVVDGVEDGDELTITIDTPPQTARHDGYETAFVDMPPLSITL